MAVFNSFGDVDEWVAEHGVDKLRELVIHPTKTHPRNRQIAAQWLQEQEEKGAIDREDERHDFMRRQTVAAELAADAAQRSARWAGLGAAIALAMLVATAWPYFKLVDLLQALSTR